MPRTLRAAVCVMVSAVCLCCLGDRAVGQPVPEHHFILLFDYPAGGLHQIDELSAAVEGWIAARLLPGDTVAVASYYGCELQIQQDFTRDRGALTAAITDAVRGRAHAGRQDSGASLAARLPRGEELARRTANFYGLLQALAEASEGIPGRKNLLVFSKGFGRSHLFEGEGGPTEHAVLTGNGLLGSPIQEKYLSDRSLYAPTLQALQKAGVSLYPVDLATDYRETYPLAGVMCQLAAGTGGRYFYPVSSIPSLLDRVNAEERVAAAPAETIERSEERVAGAVPPAVQAAESPGGEIRE
jgi:VWFA-related protein